MSKRAISTAAFNKICEHEKDIIESPESTLNPDDQDTMYDAITLIQRDVKDYLGGKDYSHNRGDFGISEIKD